MQLLRIASVLFILHICYHPRLYAAPIKEGSTNDVEESEEETQNIEQHRAAIADILNSTTFSNNTNPLLRSDNYNNNSTITNPFDLSSRRTLPYFFFWISSESWEKYSGFKKDTCRTVKEEIPKFEDQDFLENGYFKWEENEFHRELRVLLFPETSNTLKPLVDNDIIDQLDKRFLQKPLESFCLKKETKNTKEEEAAKEKATFEDIVLNRVYQFPWPGMPKNNELSAESSNETTTTTFFTTSVPFFDIISTTTFSDI